jgi:hypothetical protein
VPVGGGLDEVPEATGLENEQFGQVARKAPGSEVTAVDADAGEKLLCDAHVTRPLAVESVAHVAGVERCPVDSRANLRRVVERVAGDDIDPEPVEFATT